MTDQAIAFAIVALGIAMISIAAALPSVVMHKRGGLRFWKIGRLGGSFYISKAQR